MDKRFNLLDEPWISVVGRDRVSLITLFSDHAIVDINGSPLEKLALYKLLLAVAQAAVTPQDDADWHGLGAEGLSQRVIAYLEAQREAFWLFHPAKPFLQMPAVQKAETKPFHELVPHLAGGNNKVLLASEVKSEFDDADKALLIVLNAHMSLSSKRIDKTFSVASDYTPKKTGSRSTAIEKGGLIHTLFKGERLIDTLYMNLLTVRDIALNGRFAHGFGVAPWERMPASECDVTAEVLRNSLMGRLVGLPRFMLLGENGVHICNGIVPKYSEDGLFDPTISYRKVTEKDKEVEKPLLTREAHGIWRMLPAMLSFLSANALDGNYCLQTDHCFPRIKRTYPDVGIWFASVLVGENSGEQYFTGDKDFVESDFSLAVKAINEDWFARFSDVMRYATTVSDTLSAAVAKYFKKLSSDKSKSRASQAERDFWQRCESLFNLIYDIVANDEPERLLALKKRLRAIGHSGYEYACPRTGAKQHCSWAECRPKFKIQ